MWIKKSSIEKILDENKNLTKRVNDAEYSLKSLEYKLKKHEINHKLEAYNLVLKEEYCTPYYFIKYYSIVDMSTQKKIKVFLDLNDFHYWFEGYKKRIEDGTITVELDEEETEKVKTQKKKSKSK